MVDDIRQGGEEQESPPYSAKSPFAEREEQILEFWNRENIFQKSQQKPSPKGEYVFYDGPPFATGLPHYGHLLQSTLKDAIPRFRTMQGYHVRRQWGWDCHGLPLENQIEQELGIKTKRDIEQYGVENFNRAARNAVLRYAGDWRRIIPRMGRWADMEQDYKTMDATYTESVWWAFKNLYDRKLIYEGFKAMHLCPRCGTTLANFEVAQGYQDIKDIAVTVRLPLVDEPGTSLLVWTTTPWTLPGNTAAAVNADAVYVRARTEDGFVVVAKDLVTKVVGENPNIYGELHGRDLVGKAYTPPFAYFTDLVHKHKTHAWKVYAAPYVTLSDGTGIVHLAPAYGAEDLELAQKEKIPLVHHVTDEGKFIATVSDFAHLPVKPKGRHMETDEKICANLEARGLLFKKEIIEHPYPHCWRCDTPLLNWASNSWFVSVASIKKQLLAQNAKIRWVPEHVGRGRFQNGLKSAPDWAISRSRYWGAPIPVWRHSKTKEFKVMGSVEELLSAVRRSGNTYFVMRHGEARSNVEGFANSSNDIENHLTEKGKARVKNSAQQLAKKGIDIIVASPITRTQETAHLVAEVLGLPASAVMTDTRLSETHFGEKNGKPLAEWQAIFATLSDRFNKAAVGGETYTQVLARVGDFLFDIERRYSGKRVLIVTHGSPAWLMTKVAARLPVHKLARVGVLETGQWQQLHFVPYPHNENYELDLHRPYIDEVPLGDAISGEWKRVPDVFDCWFESGAMPFASRHYPFEKDAFNPKKGWGLFPKGYPADFIAESIDQTRGWFYSLIVLGTALFGKSPYKAVVTNGLILAQDGRKMSKKLKNYPDPMELVEKFGADSLRFYLLSSAVLRGEDLRFSAQGVEEVLKKLLMRLDNVRSFYDLYRVTPSDFFSEKVLGSLRSSATADKARPDHFLQNNQMGSLHVLDRWILSRLGELLRDSNSGYESYQLDVAVRPLVPFIDDLSTWYVRRSRERFKSEGEDKAHALSTLQFVLLVTAHIMAPVMPFFAEDLFLRMGGEGEAESVHLSHWPKTIPIDEKLLHDMTRVREVVSLALELREKAGIKIRQPLSCLSVKELNISPELQVLVAQEVNVKKVIEDTKLETPVHLETTLTDELREEGLVRDIVRQVQELRKQEKLVIEDRPVLRVVTNETGKEFFKKYYEFFIAETNLSDLSLQIKDAEVTEGRPFPLTLTLAK